MIPVPALLPFVRDIGCEVFFAPLRVRIRDGKFREPDPLLVRDADGRRCRDDYWLGADPVMEVVRPEDPDRELVEKRFDYAEAGIPEYWIVYPIDEAVTVLVLAGDKLPGARRRYLRASRKILLVSTRQRRPHQHGIGYVLGP